MWCHCLHCIQLCKFQPAPWLWLLQTRVLQLQTVPHRLDRAQRNRSWYMLAGGISPAACEGWELLLLSYYAALSQHWLCCNPTSAWSFTRPGTAGIFNYLRVNLHGSFCWNNKFVPLLLSGMSFCINIYIWVKPKKLPATIKTKELLQSKFRSQPALRTPCTSLQRRGNCNV